MKKKNSIDFVALSFIMIAMAIAAIGAVGIFFLPESYIYWNPTIDTVLPEEFTDRKFHNLKLGILKSEVLELLGKPNTVNWESDFTEWSYEHDQWVYGYDGACSWCDFAWIQYYIEFDRQGQVVHKWHEIHYD